MPVLTLSQTATPFPFALLGAATFIQSTLAGDVSVSWDRDGKTLLDGQEFADDVVLSKLGDLLKGKETASPVLPAPFTPKTPFPVVNQIFDTLDDFLALRTFFGGHSLGSKDFELWGAIKANLPAIGIIKKGLHVHLARWYNFVEQLPSTVQALASLAEAKADKGTAKKTDISLDLPGAYEGQVITRFPPEPSGYLHIGHSKAALLNRFFADKYKGKMLLRFDDTNPLKEKSEFEESITEDLALLGIKADSISHTSDWFDKLHELAIQLIKSRHAYCDDTPQMQMRDERMKGIASGRREATVEESLARFDEMTLGTDEGTKWCLRAKMSVDDPNKAMRDTVIYRCVKEAHHRTGTKYFSYPTYDFACPVVDSLEGVTHALRTNEYRDRNPQYFWFIDALNLRKPHIWDFSRLNFVYTLLSKRKLHWFVAEGKVSGWDDARFPTVRGVRRRGMTVEALREYIISQGASQSQMTLEWDGIWSINKRIIDPVVPRYCALAEKDLVKVTVTGAPAKEESKSLPKHKKNADLGNKTTVFASDILIEQVDAKSFDDNEEVTLMDWGNAFVRSKTVAADGTVTGLTLELHLAGDFKKTKKKVTWLAASSATNALGQVTLIDYDYLITKKKLEEDDKVENLVTPVTEFKDLAIVDQNVFKNVQSGDTVQFERKGYYICDQEKEADGRLRFILIPDGRAAAVESKAVAALKEAEKAAKAAGGEVVKKGKKAAKVAVDAVKQVVGGEEAGVKVHKSDITSGFDIPVSTSMFEVERVYGATPIEIDTTTKMHDVAPYTTL